MFEVHRLVITQLKAQGPPRTWNKSKEEAERRRTLASLSLRLRGLPGPVTRVTLMSLNSRLYDLLGPVTRAKKKQMKHRAGAGLEHLPA